MAAGKRNISGRIWDMAMKCAVKESKGAVLMVTHSAVIMTMLSFLYEKPFEDMVKNFKTHNAEIVEIEEKIFEK